MHRCLQLARNGELGAPPNPMVGAVLVHDGKIIGEGYHIRCGEAHAEVNAFCGIDDRDLLSGSTLYVSLEPCAHYGKTPPCAQLIVNKKIGRVVVGCIDPFAKVSGRGIQMLREAGIDVSVGVLEHECLALNRRFITFHTHHRPYIILKWAQTADGAIGIALKTGSSPAPQDNAAEQRVIISNAATLRRGHHLRATHQAILVGWRTAKNDRPSLTTRHWSGPTPRRIIFDSHGQSVESLLAELYEQGVQSLLVEGGASTHRQFMERGLWDEIHQEISDKPLILAEQEGLAPIYAAEVPQQAHLLSTELADNHTIVRYANKHTQPMLIKSQY